MRVFYHFFLVICVSAINGFCSPPSHKGYYSTRKIAYQISKEHLESAAKEAKMHNEPLNKAIIYTRGETPAERFCKYDIKILNQNDDMIMIEYRKSLKPFLYALDDVIHVQYPRQLYPVLDTSRILCGIDEAHQSSAPRYVSGPYKGKNVLVGIIDTEFDTRHPAFLDSNSTTRFIAIWDQADSSNSANNKYKFGTIKYRSELSTDTTFGTRGHFHGTLMAAAATGSDIKSGFYGVAPEALLAGVCYDYSNDLSLMNAIEWIFSLADSLNVPCVISMSIGVAVGPHDGSSELDTYIDKVSGPGRIIVGAAGNDGDARAHVLFDLDTSSQAIGTWMTPQSYISENDTFYYWRIDLWGEAQKQFQLSTQIYNTNTDELREDIDFITVGSKRSTYKPDTVIFNEDTILWYIDAERSSLNSKPHVEILAIAKKAEYHIGIRVKSTINTEIHGWNAYKKSLESFDMENYVSGDNNYSINEVGGTATRIIAVGSYLGRSALKLWNEEIVAGAETDTILKLADFSGKGPTVDGRTKPDITAPGVKVISAMSSHADDYGKTIYWPFHPQPYGRYSAATGTSISAPIVAGVIALLLQADSQLTPEEIKTALQASAKKDQFTGPLLTPDNLWGGGKLNAIGALDYVLNLPTSISSQQPRIPDNQSITMKHNSIFFTNLPANANIKLIDLHGRVLHTSYDSNGSFRCPETNGQFILLCKVSGNTVLKKKIIVSH